jgi:hypothetical protein
VFEEVLGLLVGLLGIVGISEVSLCSIRNECENTVKRKCFAWGSYYLSSVLQNGWRPEEPQLFAFSVSQLFRVACSGFEGLNWYFVCAG